MDSLTLRIPWDMSSWNSFQALMPSFRFSSWDILTLDARTWRSVWISSSTYKHCLVMNFDNHLTPSITILLSQQWHFYTRFLINDFCTKLSLYMLYDHVFHNCWCTLQKKLFSLGVNNWETSILQQPPMHPRGRIHKQHGCVCTLHLWTVHCSHEPPDTE